MSIPAVYIYIYVCVYVYLTASFAFSKQDRYKTEASLPCFKHGRSSSNRIAHLPLPHW